MRSIICLARNQAGAPWYDRTIERPGKRVEARALGGEGGRFRLILRHWSEPFNLAFHVGELRPESFRCRGRLVNDPLDVGAQALALALALQS